MGSPHVVLLPGFSRQAEHTAAMADLCRERGWTAVPVTLAPRALAPIYMSTTRLRAVARDIVRSSSGSPVVVVGHSAGASAGCFISAFLRGKADVRGLVMADGVDSPNGLIRRYLPDLSSLRVSAVFADASPCNRNGKLENEIGAYPWVRYVHVLGARHGDFEGNGIAIYTRVCGDRSTPDTSRRFRDELVRQVEWVLA